MFRTWLRPIVHRDLRRIKRGRHTVSLPKPHRQLRLEVLEDRLAPATHTWTGAVSGSWANNANWVGNSPAGDNSADLVFPTTAQNFTNTNDISTSFSVQSITFSGNSNYIIGGNAITLNGGGILLDNTVTTGVDTLNLDITLGVAQTWTVTNPNTVLAVGGVISGTAGAGLTKAGAGTLVLTSNNSFQGGVTLTAGILSVGSNTALGTATANLNGGTLEAGTPVQLANLFDIGASATIGGSTNITFAGPFTLGGGSTLTVSNTGTTSFSAALGGPGALTVAAGTGAVVLAVANSTYTGNTTLASGTLSLGNGMALGSGILNFTGGTLLASAPLTLGNPIDVNAAPSAATIVGGSNNLILTGPVSLLNAATPLMVTDTGGVTFQGSLTGAGGLIVMAGTGTVLLLVANSYTGTTTLDSGILIVGDPSALGTDTLALNGGNFQSNGALTLNNPFTVGGPATIGGANNLTFAGAGTLNTGSTLTVNNTGITTFSGVLSGAGGLTNAGTGMLILSGANTYTGPTTIDVGTLQLGASDAVPSGSAVTVAAGATFDLNNFNDAIGSLAGAGDVNLGSGNLSIGSDNTNTVFSGVISGTGSLTKTGAGSLTLSGTNTYTGTTSLNTGTLIVGNDSALGPTGTLNLNGGTLQANETITLPNPFTVGGSAAIATGAAANILTLNGAGTLNAGSALTLTSSPGTVTLAGNLSGSGSLFMNATGTLAVSGPNNSGFSGLVQLASGTLSVGSNNALGTGALTINGGTIESSGAFSIDNSFTVGGAVTVGGGNNLTFTGTGTATAAHTLTVTNTATTTFSGVLSGPLAIAENAGTGTLILSAVNTYTGGTTLTSGTLTVDNDSALGTGMLALNGGTLQAAAAVTLANTFTVGGGSTIGGGNNLTFTGAGTLGAGATLTVADTATTTFAGVLSGGGGLTETAGTGTLILSAANTYTGATTINSGTLQLGANDAIPGTSAVSLATGATLDLNNFSDAIGSLAGAGNVNLGSGTLSSGGNNTSTTFSGIISGTGGLTKTGTGTFTVGGNNTYTGPTTVMAGILLVNGSQPTSNVTVASGATLGGAGTVGTITTAGTVSPGGPATGILQSGNAVFNAGSSFAVTLNGTTVGTGYDQLNVTGSVDLTASPTLRLMATFVASVGNTFTIIMSTGGITGTFAGLPENSIVSSGGQSFHINYTTNAVTLTRTLSNTTTVVTSSANPSVFGQPVTFSAMVTPVPPVTGTPTGIVTFQDGATVLGTGTLVNGVATFTTTTPLSLGTHAITAIYNGDNIFASSTSAPLTQTVNQANTTTTLSSSANPAAIGQLVTFTATVTAASPGMGIPTGTVTFRDGTTVLGTSNLGANGQATFQTSTLTQGAHSITATYSGDSSFLTSTSAVLTQSVRAATSTVVTSSANPAVFGQAVTFTATVTAAVAGTGTPTGTVTFMDGNTTLGTGTLNASGIATFTSTTLGTGTHTITVAYGGDSGFAASTSAAFTQTVSQASTTTTLTSSLNPSTSGQAVTFTAVVTATSSGAGTPTGTVTFQEGTTVLGTSPLTAGRATFQTTTLSTGTHQITAVYSGETNFTGSTSAALAQTVNATTPTGTQNQRFVTQVYRDILGRDPDAGGLSFFTSMLDTNQATRTQVALGIQTSPEARTRQIETLYQMFLGRQADPVGLDLSTRFLNAGGSFYQLEATIVGSPEYFQRAGGTNNGFLTAVYRDALGRAIDSVGQSLGSQALTAGTSRITLADTVFTSPEGLQDSVQSFYSQFLHRNVDGVGLNLSTNALRLRVRQEMQQQQEQAEHGPPAPAGASVDQLISVIAGSDEYFGRV